MSVGQSTAFVAELDPSLFGAASLIYSSYLGNSSAAARGLGIAVDSGGNAYVTGYTYPGFPTTTGAYETADPAVRTKQAGQPTAAFVVKIDPPAGAKPAVSTDVLVAPAAANAPVNTAAALAHVSPAQSVDRPSSSTHQTNVETRFAAARKATDAVFSNWGEF